MKIIIGPLAALLIASCATNKEAGSHDKLSVIRKYTERLESIETSRAEATLEIPSITLSLYDLGSHKITGIEKKINSDTIKKLLEDKTGKDILDYALKNLSSLLGSADIVARTQAESILLNILKEKLLNPGLREVRTNSKYLNSIISLSYLNILLAYQDNNHAKLPDHIISSHLKEILLNIKNGDIKILFENIINNSNYNKLKVDLFIGHKQLYDEAIYQKGLALKSIGISKSEEFILYFKSLVYCISIIEIHKPSPYYKYAMDEIKSAFTILSELNTQ